MAKLVLAVLQIGEKALKIPLHYLIASASFSVLFFFNLPFPLVIVSAMGIGYFFMPRAQDESQIIEYPPPLKDTLRVLMVGLGLFSGLNHFLDHLWL